MILGKRDKAYVKSLESQLPELENKIETLTDKLESQKARVEEKEKTILNLSASVYILKDIEYLHKDLELSYQAIAKYMGISTSTLTKYRNGSLELTPVRYKELMTNLIKSILEDTK